MSYMEALVNLGEVTGRELSRLLKAYLAGEVSMSQLVDLSTVTISLAQQQGRIMAEVSLLSWMTANGLAEQPAAARPIPHYADSDRVRSGVQTIMERGVIDPDQVDMQLQRLGYSESVESSQRAMSAAMQESGVVDGWTRGLEPDACQLCQWWARDGQVWPVNHSMPTHKGCCCTPIPTNESVGHIVRRRPKKRKAVTA